jgi:hypothetical protein
MCEKFERNDYLLCRQLPRISPYLIHSYKFIAISMNMHVDNSVNLLSAKIEAAMLTENRCLLQQPGGAIRNCERIPHKDWKDIISVLGLLYRLIWIATEGLFSSGKVGKNTKLDINMHSVTCMKMGGIYRYPCNRPWRSIGLWDVEVPIFSR